jgi:hypothetical protein
MTTVVYRDGILAADRKIDGWQSVCKLIRLKSGAYISGAGNWDDVVEVARWLDAKAVEANKPTLTQGSTSVIYLDSTGLYWMTDPFLRKVKVEEPYYAIGSGAHFALGALAMGATAHEAVEIAMQFDSQSGHGIDSIKVISKATK